MNDKIRCSIEIREDDTRQSPGRLVGTLMAYGKRASDRPELFKSGSLTWPDDGIVIREQHNRLAPIMRVVPEVRENAVVIDAPLPDTQRGRDAATNIRAGVFKGLSVEFRAKSEKRVAGVREIAAAVLTGAGLVDEPSYSEASVSMRSKTAGGRLEVPWWL